MRHLLTAIAIFLTIQAAHAERRTEADWPEHDIIQFLGKPTKIIRQKERGCNEVFYQYDIHGPQVQIEFRCDHLNVAWILYKEPKFQKQDKQALALAESAIRRLTRTEAAEVALVNNGAKLEHYSVNDELEASGSCGLWQCLLTFTEKP